MISISLINCSLQVISKDLYDKYIAHLPEAQEIIPASDKSLKDSSKFNWVLDKIPLKQKSRAKALLKILLDGRNFDFSTSNGQIEFNGVVGFGSHIVDLISLAVKPFPIKNWRIPGLDIFCKA